MLDSTSASSATPVSNGQGYPGGRLTQPHAQHARVKTSVHADGSDEQSSLGPILSGDGEH